jgi:hypothetical protein
MIRRFGMLAVMTVNGAFCDEPTDDLTHGAIFMDAERFHEPLERLLHALLK